MASEYGWLSVEKIGFYDALMLIEFIVDRKKENILMMNVATNADPKELRKQFSKNSISQVKLNEAGLERFKNTLSSRSQFKIK